MDKSTLKIKFSNALFHLGVYFLLSPILLYWFIHGSYERYIWIIHGPHPFSSFGGGPFQLWMFIGLMIIGMTFIGASRLLKRKKIK